MGLFKVHVPGSSPGIRHPGQVRDRGCSVLSPDGLGCYRFSFPSGHLSGGHAAQLQTASLSQEMQASIQDLPFDGVSLFSDQTDVRLHDLQDTKATLHSMGMHKPQSSRQPFQPPHLLGIGSLSRGLKGVASSFNRPFTGSYIQAGVTSSPSHV